MHRSRASIQIRVPKPEKCDPRWFYKDAANPGRRRHGIILIDGKEVAATLQCSHCGCHFVHRKHRGDWICLKCAGVVCGKAECVRNCVPFEKKLDEYESGKIGVL